MKIDWDTVFDEPSVLRLDRLTLRNFRCFAECELKLHPKLTVLVAENGRGKTAILDAIAIALEPLVDAIADTTQARGFGRTDVRLLRDSNGNMSSSGPTEVIASGAVGGFPLEWNAPLRIRKTKRKSETKTLFSVAETLRHSVDAYESGGQGDPPSLPLVTYFGTSRFTSESSQIRGRRPTYPRPPKLYPPTLDRLKGYFGCLSSSSLFSSFVARYEGKIKALKLSTASAFGLNDRPEKLIAAVREAVKMVLEPTGWKELDWSDELSALVVEHRDHGRLPLSVLSDGVRNMIALVGDLALRCVELNPHFRESAARLTSGILLVDEVDMHLHPRWQQLVVDLLKKAFPAMQLVLSTHSPHVLSTVDVESIRIIRFRDGGVTLDTPTFQTRGVESADVLATIMGVDPVPQVEEARWLSNYRALIEDGKAETIDAQDLRVKLARHFGSKHPLILDCDRLIRFQEFKLRRARPEGGGYAKT